MASLLLAVIYLAFISLGLPDALLGSAWPLMYGGFAVPVSSAGIISMTIAGGTIVSSLFSDRLIRRFGTAAVTLVSVGMTALALFGFSISHAFWQLCLWAVPYGLGAGSVDAALNNFVALHYRSRHMSWLHCFWGIGATAGPYIMGLCLTGGATWHAGYRSIGVIQVVLAACLLLSLPLWKGRDSGRDGSLAGRRALSLRETVRLPRAKPLLTAFFCYCALEATAGLWASSYLVLYRGVEAGLAAKYASLFYLGITLGRFFCGFVSDRLGDHNMVRLGQGIAGLGALLLLLPLGGPVTLCALVALGMGCAPIYPSLLHATPVNFGAENSQSVMGMQMACAYVGSTFMPPVFGWLAGWAGLSLYPLYLLAFVLLMVLMTERAGKGPAAGEARP